MKNKKFLREYEGKNWKNYCINGRIYARLKLKETSPGVSMCSICECLPNQYHCLGCENEYSVCEKCPGRMIDCNCEYFKDEAMDF